MPREGAFTMAALHARRVLWLRYLVTVATIVAAGVGGWSIAAERESEPQPVVVEVRSGRSIGRAELVERLAAARFRLLGEIHDNPEHHELRANLIRDIVAKGPRPAVALEVFDLDRAVELRAAQAEGIVDAERLADQGLLDRGAWRWPLHRPVVQAALAAGLPLHAANLSRRSLQRTMRGAAGSEADAPWSARLRAAAWTAAQESMLEDSIVEGHCGKLPAEVVGRIARAQRERDAAMAQVLIDVATPDGAILLAGNGHVRNDIGVPAYLPERGHVSVGFVESEGDLTAGAGRREALAANPGFDFVWFTGKAERKDPCALVPTDAGK